jgi:hypothetical protein
LGIHISALIIINIQMSSLSEKSSTNIPDYQFLGSSERYSTIARHYSSLSDESSTGIQMNQEAVPASNQVKDEDKNNQLENKNKFQTKHPKVFQS